MRTIYLIIFSFILISCHKEEDHIYNSIGEVDIVNGERTGDAKYSLIARSYNNEDLVMNFIAAYDSATQGKLTFKIDIKNALGELVNDYFYGKGEPAFNMSLSRTDDHFDSEFINPVFIDKNQQKDFRVKLRLKGELYLNSKEWYMDYAYVVLSRSFQPYPLDTSEDVFLCKSNAAFLNYYQMDGFNSMPRAGTFDISYDRCVSFDELYFNLFCNITGLLAVETVTLKLDKESFLEIYKIE